MEKENKNLNSIISVIVISAVAVTGILFGGKEVINNRIEIVDKTTVDRDYETIETVESPEYLGGLVHHVQEIFVAGIKAGSSETEVINSSGQWVYQFNGTTIAASTIAASGAITGATTLTMTGETNLDSLVFGGTVLATSSDVAATMVATDFCDYSVIRFTPNVTAVTLTLPATSTLAADCLPTAGDTRIVLLENATSGTANLTIAAGTDMTLLEPSGGDVIIAQNEWAFIRIIYVDESDWAAVVTSIQDAD